MWSLAFRVVSRLGEICQGPNFTLLRIGLCESLVNSGNSGCAIFFTRDYPANGSARRAINTSMQRALLSPVKRIKPADATSAVCSKTAWLAMLPEAVKSLQRRRNNGCTARNLKKLIFWELFECGRTTTTVLVYRKFARVFLWETRVIWCNTCSSPKGGWLRFLKIPINNCKLASAPLPCVQFWRN